ncbi:MoaD/ThiS family protein [Microbacteriaceae bacterium VKM Ac-2855]|nr:MoaD/ThiS family protein [Microbacteriaceae bacterium VKM Ac-2855]
MSGPVTEVRYFAAAKAALGIRSETVTAPTLGALEVELLARVPEAAAVLARCSFMVDGVSTRDRSTTLAGVARVDVLPPFAGG